MNRISDFALLVDATVVDCCATIRLATGEDVLWDGIVNPEWQGTREFIDWDDTQSIVLPVEYE